MEISAAFLCDFAEAREGLLMAIAGGVTRVWAEEYPASLGVTLAMLLSLDEHDSNIPHDMDVRVMGPDSPIGGIQGGFLIGRGDDIEPGELVIAPVTLDLRPIAVPAPGGYSIHINIDGGAVEQTVSCVVRPRTAAG